MFVFPSQKHKLPALHIFVILLHQILLILVTILIIHLFPAGLPACFPHGHNQGAKVVSKLVSNMHSMKRIKEVSLHMIDWALTTIWHKSGESLENTAIVAEGNFRCVH